VVLAIYQADGKAVMVALVFALGIGLQAAPATTAVSPEVPRIIVLKGDNGVNILKKKTAVTPVVEIRDADNLPACGATVTFTAPERGPTVKFGNGRHSFTAITDAEGHAAAVGMKPRNSGAFKITVSASMNGVQLSVAIAQINLGAPPAGITAGAAIGAVFVGGDVRVVTTRELLIGSGQNDTYIPAELSSATREIRDYGLYSYIVFGSPPGPAKIDGYRSLVRSYLDRLHDRRLFDGKIPKRKLNVTYLPVSPDRPREKDEDLAGWLLNNHDYGRAAIIASNAELTPTDGPYIVSSLAPLSEGGRAKTRIIFQQDLSWVSANLMPLYLTLFEQRVSGRLTTWSRTTLESFALELRTVVQATADEAGSAVPALAGFIQVRQTSR
jgi:hypothetical protein